MSFIWAAPSKVSSTDGGRGRHETVRPASCRNRRVIRTPLPRASGGRIALFTAKQLTAVLIAEEAPRIPEPISPAAAGLGARTHCAFTGDLPGEVTAHSAWRSPERPSNRAQTTSGGFSRRANFQSLTAGGF